MSEIRTFRLEKTEQKLSSDFRRLDFGHSGCSGRAMVWLYYNCQKPEHSAGRVDQTNVRNPNKMVWISDTV